MSKAGAKACWSKAYRFDAQQTRNARVCDVNACRLCMLMSFAIGAVEVRRGADAVGGDARRRDRADDGAERSVFDIDLREIHSLERIDANDRSLLLKFLADMTVPKITKEDQNDASWRSRLGRSANSITSPSTCAIISPPTGTCTRRRATRRRRS